MLDQIKHSRETGKRKESDITQVHRASFMNMDKINPDLSDTAKYRYDCILKYKKLKTKGFKEQETLEFIGVKRSTFYGLLNKFNKKFGNIDMKTAGFII